MWFLIIVIGVMIGYTLVFLMTDDLCLLWASLCIVVFLSLLTHYMAG